MTVFGATRKPLELAPAGALLLPPAPVAAEPYNAEMMRDMYRALPPFMWTPEEDAIDYDYNCGGCLSEYLSRLNETGGRFGVIVEHPNKETLYLDDDGKLVPITEVTSHHVIEPPLEPLLEWVDHEPAREELRPIILDALSQHDYDLVHQSKRDEDLRIILQCFGYDDARTATPPATIKLYDPLGKPMSIDLISSNVDPKYEYVARVNIVVHLPNHRDIEYVFDGEEYLDIIKDEPIDAQPA